MTNLAVAWSGGKFCLVESKMALGPISQIAFQAEGNTPKCKVPPGNIFRSEDSDFQALFPGAVFRADQPATIKKMYLIDMGDADHGEGGVDNDSCSRLFKGFPAGALSGGFAVFHKSSRECPETMLGFDCPTAKQNFPFPFCDATNNQSRVFVVNVAAGTADVPRQ